MNNNSTPLLALIGLTLSFPSPALSQNITPQTALQSYLNNGDNSFKWEQKRSYTVDDVQCHDLLLTSQTWRGNVWTHQLTLVVPKNVKYDNVLLNIIGGSIKNGQPNWASKKDDSLFEMAQLANTNKAIIALLCQTPNQPLYNGLVEDQLISFTLHNFKNDGDYSWPLLFPMTKSAIRAMDAVQEFTSKKLNQKTNSFLVTGGSKRGWTTWLAGAHDQRVKAIAPMVIDVLNMPVSLDYQVEAWKEYSIQIQDYTKLEIPQSVHTPQGNAITAMIDPYSYRAKLTLPKMIFMGTNDEYWPVDAVKKYWNGLPGKKYIHYVPNAGHGLGNQREAFKALGAFWANTIQNAGYNACHWKVSQSKTGIDLTVNVTRDKLIGASLWYTDSKDRDFRDEHWSSEDLPLPTGNTVSASLKFPRNGFRAGYLDLKYLDANSNPYTKSTRMFLLDNDEAYMD